MAPLAHAVWWAAVLAHAAWRAAGDAEADPFGAGAEMAFTQESVLVGPKHVHVRSLMRHALAQRADARAAALASSARTAELVRGARRGGARVGALGLELDRWFAPRVANGTAAATLVASDAELQGLLTAYFAPVDWAAALCARQRASLAGQAGQAGAKKAGDARLEPNMRFTTRSIAERTFALDAPARYPPPRALTAALAGGGGGGGGAAAAARARELYGALARDGFARVDAWPGLDIDALTQRTRAAFSELGVPASADDNRTNPVQVLDVPGLSPVLEGVLQDEGVRRAVHAYLGAGGERSVRALGYTVLRLGTTLSKRSQYPSAIWHHDRAGRRLKLFIFLHDVDPARGRPTVVARGTHNTHWYYLTSSIDTRFSERWVRGRFETVALGGRRGGGFLLDTNALHKGEHLGEHGRDVLIVELDAAGRCDALKGPPPNKNNNNGKYRTPCPSEQQKPLDVEMGEAAAAEAAAGGPRAMGRGLPELQLEPHFLAAARRCVARPLKLCLPCDSAGAAGPPAARPT